MTNFTNMQIQRLLQGLSVRLTTLANLSKNRNLKGKEYADYAFTKKIKAISVYKENTNEDNNAIGTFPHRIKWQVGRSYAVMQGGKQVWHCPKCNYCIVGKGFNGNCFECTVAKIGKENAFSGNYSSNDFEPLKPLRFVVRKIRVENKNWIRVVEKAGEKK